jgi:hypothetical protein
MGQLSEVDATTGPRSRVSLAMAKSSSALSSRHSPALERINKVANRARPRRLRARGSAYFSNTTRAVFDAVADPRESAQPGPNSSTSASRRRLAAVRRLTMLAR